MSLVRLALSASVERGRIERLLTRFGKFGLVGASGAVINILMFWLLTNRVGLHYLVAGPFAIELALCSNYVLNNNWTFADRRSGLVNVTRMARYQVVSLGGVLINLSVLHTLVAVFGMPPVLANIIGIGLGACWNFGLSTRWAWRPAQIAIGSGL